MCAKEQKKAIERATKVIKTQNYWCTGVHIHYTGAVKLFKIIVFGNGNRLQLKTLGKNRKINAVCFSCQISLGN